MSEPVSYTAALAELDAILADLESDEVDVDRLAQQVQRAATLIEICRNRIEGARLEVTRIVASLTPEAPDAGPEGSA